MRCLIIIAHPLETSLNHHFAKTAYDALSAQGHEVQIVDLYKQDFDPRLTSSEHTAYHSASEHTAEIENYGRALQDAELLVLVFPTWWFSLPAIIKGWLDRVFVPGIAFDDSEDFGPIKPRLQKLQRVVTITTLGSPWWVDRIVMLQPIKRILKTAIFRSCAPQSRFTYLPFYIAEKPSKQRIATFEKRIFKALQ